MLFAITSVLLGDVHMVLSHLDDALLLALHVCLCQQLHPFP